MSYVRVSLFSNGCRPGFACVVTRAWQVGLVNKCVLPAIGIQEIQVRAAGSLRFARYAPLKLYEGAVISVICVSECRRVGMQLSLAGLDFL